MTELHSHQHFFNLGRTQSVSWRKKQLRILLKAVTQYETELYQAFKTDLHKGRFETLSTEIGLVKRSIRHTIKHLSSWTEQKHKNTPSILFGKKSFTVYEPYGTVLIIGPFNYPFLSVIEPLIGAVASGNTAVIKPSELTPNVSKVIEEMIHTHFTSSYIEVVTGGVSTTQSLLDKNFDFIFFTGSPRVGRIVMEKASKNLTPVLLELGGKSPVVVLNDADVKLAAGRIIWGKLMNAGQTCIAPDYCLVHTSLKDKLLKAMVKEIKSLYGKNAQLSKDYGRIVSRRHADRLIEMINNHSDEIVYGGNYDDRYIEPTVLDLKSADGPSMEEEIFGPVLPVVSFSTEEEMYQVIKQYPKPLAFYIFGKNEQKMNHIINNVSSGAAVMNDVMIHAANEHLPFGGVGGSGIGRFHGRYSIEAFSHEKAIMISKFHGTDSFLKAPYTRKKYSLLKRLFR